MSRFVGLISRNHFRGHYRNPSRCKDRLKCNSHFRGSDSLSLHLIPLFSILTSISCSLNCYPVEMMIDSLQNVFTKKKTDSKVIKEIEK